MKSANYTIPCYQAAIAHNLFAGTAHSWSPAGAFVLVQLDVRAPVVDVIVERRGTEEREQPSDVLVAVHVREYTHVMRWRFVVGLDGEVREMTRGLAARALVIFFGSQPGCSCRPTLAILTSKELNKLMDFVAAAEMLRKQVGRVDLSSDFQYVDSSNSHLFLYP